MLNRSPDYPPRGLAPQVKHLPERIRRGLGDDEYYCEEVGATFPADEVRLMGVDLLVEALLRPRRSSLICRVMRAFLPRC